MQQEGYDLHDFELFDDRSSVLWRKPYIDGAVRELTSGDTRSQEQMRQMIERMMIAAGNSNPDVRHTTRKAHHFHLCYRRLLRMQLPTASRLDPSTC